MESLFQSIGSRSFIPHGYCFSWNPALLWTFVSSDAIISVSYFSIPFALLYFSFKRPDIQQRKFIALFGLFIVSCGITHIFEILTIWSPIYWANALSKSITALVSLITAVMLWRIMPAALNVPSPQQLENANRQLEESKELLELRVEERTVALSNSEEQLRLVLEGAELGFWDWNIISNHVERNEQWARMLGYTVQEIKNTTQQWADFIHPDDRKIALESINSVVDGRSSRHKLEYRMLHKDGSIRWVLDQARVMGYDSNGKPTRMSGIHSDVTERKQIELRLQQQAHFDFLTGACNRGYFIERAETELARSIRYNKPLSVLMLDIDFFKTVNDSHGHKVGDAVLKNLVAICQQSLREIDIVGRIGGEEFAMLLPETDKEKAVDVAERLREAVSTNIIPLEEGLHLNVTVSIGISSLESMDDNLAVILSHADKALYQAKHTGRNKVCAAA